MSYSRPSNEGCVFLVECWNEAYHDLKLKILAARKFDVTLLKQGFRAEATIIFNRPGLTVYAVSWEYVFMARQIDWWNYETSLLHGRCNALPPSIHIVEMLSMHIRLRRGQGNETQPVVSVNVLGEINAAYKGHHGIPTRDPCIPGNSLAMHSSLFPMPSYLWPLTVQTTHVMLPAIRPTILYQMGDRRPAPAAVGPWQILPRSASCLAWVRA